MSSDQLFRELCKPETMRIGWYLAQSDSRDDFVTDPIGHADFAFNLDHRLKHLVEQIQAHRYRPHHLLDVDIPKSGLSVRPGNILPIEESALLHSIVYLLAPHLDKRLDDAVYSYRLHPDWKKRIKKRDSLFREADIEFPFLKRSTISLISPFEAWYELWPDFETDAIKACTEEGYTHLTKTDIVAYFENIDLRLLESQIKSLLKREEEKILQVLFRVLEGWTRVTSTGTPIERGIPQGNEISSFLGNLYLVPLDRVLNKFCKSRDAKWFRYVDDVKIFTRSDQDAREAVFVINNTLRALHLNLQGSKTDILSGNKLKDELNNSESELVEKAIDNVRKLNLKRVSDRKLITNHLKPLSTFVSRFRKGLPNSVTSLTGKQNRLFRRLMTLYGFCERTHLKKAAFAALKHLPDLRILNKTLSYVSQLDIRTHDETIKILFELLETKELPFPYQVAMVLSTIAKLHPIDPNSVASRIRSCGLKKKQHWVVVQKAIEAIAVYPYQPNYVLNISKKYLRHEHPMVRRAACMLLTRSSKHELRKHLSELVYHPDPGVNRMALYFQRLIKDKNYSKQVLSRMTNGSKTDYVFQKSVPNLCALAATEEKKIACEVYNLVKVYPPTKSQKNSWQRKRLLELTKWSL